MSNNRLSDAMARHRACDACRYRKIKCSGGLVCEQCTKFRLPCVYSVQQKRVLVEKKKRSRRGQVISSYREAVLEPRAAALEPGELQLTLQTMENDNVIDKSVFTRIVEDYMVCIYPMFPIVSRNELTYCIDNMSENKLYSAFVHAVTLVTTCYTNSIQGNADSNLSQMCSLMLHKAIESRGPIMPDAEISVLSIITATFIACGLVSFNKIDSSWLYLREAMTMVTTLNINDAKSPSKFDLKERSRRQRLYWLLYIHERFIALHYYRPVILQPLDSFPERDPSLPEGVDEGFKQIIRLFRFVDSQFLNARLGDSSGVTEKWIEDKQREIETSEIELENLSEIQRVDLIVTQQWLKVLVWKVAMGCHTPRTSHISKDFMSVLFPIKLFRELKSLIYSTSIKSIEVHGPSIMLKLLELCLIIGDVIIQMSPEMISEIADRIDDYVLIATFLLGSQQIDAASKQLCKEKLLKVEAIACQNNDSGSTNTAQGTRDLPDSPHGDTWLSLSQWISLYMHEFTPLDSQSMSLLQRMPTPLIPQLNSLSASSQDLLKELDSGFID